MKKYIVVNRLTGEVIQTLELSERDLEGFNEAFNNMGYELIEKVDAKESFNDNKCKQCGNTSKDTYYCKKYHNNNKHFGG